MNCQWTSWGAYGSCSVTCGKGEKIRIRGFKVRPKCRGMHCSGNFTETMSCNTQCCPIHCQWASWGSYGSCSKTCGIGFKVQTRQIAVSSDCNGTACDRGNANISPCYAIRKCSASDKEQLEISGNGWMKPQLRPLHDFAEDDNKAIALQKRSYSTGIMINSLYVIYLQ